MSIIARSYTFRSGFLLLTGTVSLLTFTTQPAAAAQSTRPLAGISYFQKEPIKNADELALDASRKTPLLDEIPGYAAGVAQHITLDQQHTVYFNVKAYTYPFIIKTINGDDITAQIASGIDTKIITGHTESYDADHDSHDDISITLNAINGDTAQLTVRKLPQETPQITAVSIPPFVCFKWGLLAVLFVLSATIIIIRTRQKHIDTKSKR